MFGGNDNHTRTVWFHRNYQRMQGGHLVHAHYYADVDALDGFKARITFTNAVEAQPDAVRQIAHLWPERSGNWASHWQPAERDFLFLAGQDWCYLLDQGLDQLSNPRINLIQHVRHAEPGTRLHSFLSYRAIRICVSEQVAHVISQVPELNGPVFVIPNGCDLPVQQPSEDLASAEPRISVLGYKNPELARSLAGLLNAKGIPCALLDRFIPRDEFIQELSNSDIAICIPRREEGFYLPALEAMSLSSLVVTADCVGNQSFCRHQHNCLIADFTPESFLAETLRAKSLTTKARTRILTAARDTADALSLNEQRRQFHDLLKNVDQLW